jgi:hypothetical protein
MAKKQKVTMPLSEPREQCVPDPVAIAVPADEATPGALKEAAVPAELKRTRLPVETSFANEGVGWKIAH